MPELIEDSPISMFDVRDDLNLDNIFSTDPKPEIILNEEGSTELATLTSGLLGQSTQSIKEEYSQGTTTGVTFAKEALSKKKIDSQVQKIEEDIAMAESPEAVAEILTKSQDTLRTPVSMLDFRQNFIVESITPPSNRVPFIVKSITDDAILAEETSKAQAKLWENTSYGKVFGDFVEIFLPTGVITEEYEKWDNGLNEVLEKIRNAPKEEQREVFEGLVQAWLETETLLINNNNSILIADQLQGLEEAIREGGLGLIESGDTDAEAQDRVETALNATIFGYEAKALAKGSKGLFKFLTSRIFPSQRTSESLLPSERIPFTPFTDSKNTLSLTDEVQPVTTSPQLVYNTREGTTAYDQVAKEKISKFYKDSQEKGLAGVAKDAGLPQEALALRLVPTPSDTTDVAYPNISSQVNELILADQDELVAGTARGVKLERESGKTLKLQESGTSIVPNNDERSWGNFKFLFGNGDDGFESSVDAQKAMENGLVGVDSKRVVERNGKWYVEVEQKHTFDPKYDTKDLYVGTGELKNDSGYIIDPLRRLGEDVLRGVFALKNYNRSQAQKMQDELQAVFSKDKGVLSKWGLKPMKAEDTNALTKALEHTDQDGVDWIGSVDEYAGVVGMSIDNAQRTWKRYQRVQKVMDDVYQIRNEKYRKSLVAKGVKDVNVGDESFRGSPVKTSEKKPIYNPVTKQLIAEDDILESQSIIRLQNPVVDDAGELRRFVVVEKVDVKELPAKVLNQRQGHIDRFYRDIGWTVKVNKVRVVDGVDDPYSSTTHIVSSKKEADRIVRETLEETGEESVAVRARENDELDSIYGDESSVQYGYAGVHTKQRGGILKGSDGMDAPTAGMLESLSRTVSSVEKQLDVDIINSLRSRFMKQFEQYFAKKGGTTYSGRFEDMFDASKIPEEVAEKAKQWHNYIESISKIRQGKGFAAIDSQVNKILKATGLNGADSQAISSFAQNFTTQMVIVGRPLFQIPQNFTQLAYVLMKYPVDGGKSIGNLPSVLSALGNPSPERIKAVARGMGIGEADASALIKDLSKNGLYDAIGMSDDFMRMVAKSSVDASTTTVGNVGNIAKNTAMSPLRASKAGQEGVLKLVNITAYLAEYRKQVIKGGRTFNAKTKADMNYNAQKITQTQNSVNQFNYQDKSSILSPMFQFMQHVHKMYLDVIVDPALKLTKDPIMKALGKEVPDRVSPLASSYLQAAGTLMATYAVFGPKGVAGNILGSKVEDAINQIEDPILKETLQANILNEVINSSVNALGAEGSVDYASTVHPASFIDTFYEYHVEAFFQDGTINVAGATGYMGGVVYDAAKAIGAIATTEGLEWDEKASNITAEALRTITGVSDYEKAYIAYNLGNYVYKSTLSGNLTVTPYEAIMQMGNFNPTAVQERWSEFSGGGKTKESAVKGVAKIYSRLMHRDLAEASSFEEMLVIGQKYSSIAQASVDPLQRQLVVKELSRSVTEVGDKSYLDYIKPYMEQKKLSDVIYELKSARESASTDEHRKAIDNQIAILQPIVEEIEKVYGK